MQPNKTEIWVKCLDVPSWEVSSLGSIRNAETKLVYKTQLNPNGYLYISNGREKKTYTVSRLIAKSFYGDSQLEVNHIDGNKTNNCVTNLEFVTTSQNAKHRHHKLGKKTVKPMYGDQNPMRKNGSPFIGSKHPRSKLTENDVRKIKDCLISGEQQNMIAKQFSITPQMVYRIKTNKAWTHI